MSGMATYSLGAADFVRADFETFERFVVPSEHKLEARPQLPGTPYAWRRSAQAEIDAFCALYGHEHKAEREAALEILFSSAEENKQKFPWPYVKDLWEELWGVVLLCSSSFPDSFQTIFGRFLRQIVGQDFHQIFGKGVWGGEKQ